MSFVSLEFLLFFTAVVALYFVLRPGWRVGFLLVASYLFYAYWNAYYLVLILTSTLVDYTAAQRIARSENERHRRGLLLVSLAANLGILFVFKYFNFFSASAAALLASIGVEDAGWTLQLLLPVGISFYTFQSMAYTIDVYRGQISPERNIFRFALYVAFFPQLVAGPIERAANILPQFREHHRFDYSRVVSGLRLILWGIFKKVVIGDGLAPFVNEVYANSSLYTGWDHWLATIFFAFQIYCDFSGYSDIAVGTARVMGYNLTTNFRQPYFAQSVSGFWRRWHISLSTWFRDYVYFPLGGSQVPIARHLFNLLVVFVLSGLWHGAAWTFVIWGLIHGVIVAAEAFWRRQVITQRAGAGIPVWLSWLGAMFVVVIAWVFFRAPDVASAFQLVGSMLNVPQLFADWQSALALLQRTNILISLALIAFLMLADWFDDRVGLHNIVDQQPVAVRWVLYYAAVGAVFVNVMSGTVVQEFIYFQF